MEKIKFLSKFMNKEYKFDLKGFQNDACFLIFFDNKQIREFDKNSNELWGFKRYNFKELVFEGNEETKFKKERNFDNMLKILPMFLVACNSQEEEFKFLSLCNKKRFYLDMNQDTAGFCSQYIPFQEFYFWVNSKKGAISKRLRTDKNIERYLVVNFDEFIFKESEEGKEMLNEKKDPLKDEDIEKFHCDKICEKIHADLSTEKIADREAFAVSEIGEIEIAEDIEIIHKVYGQETAAIYKNGMKINLTLNPSFKKFCKKETSFEHGFNKLSQNSIVEVDNDIVRNNFNTQDSATLCAPNFMPAFPFGKQVGYFVRFDSLRNKVVVRFGEDKIEKDFEVYQVRVVEAR